MKNFILKLITILSIILVVFGICTMDSENQIVPICCIVIPCIWIILFLYANYYYEVKNN